MDVSSQSGGLDQKILVGLVPHLFHTSNSSRAGQPGNPGNLGYFDHFTINTGSRLEKSRREHFSPVVSQVVLNK
jgi:hypothetical protein